MKYYVGIDLGGTNLRVSLFDENAKIINVFKEKSIHDFKEKLYEQIKKMLLKLELNNYDVQAIGISLCGQENNGVITYAPNLNVTGLNLKERLEHDFSLPIKIINDANASALAEAKLGIKDKYQNFLFVTISSGLGAGLIYQGKLINLPFEVGHQLITYKDKDYDVEYLLSGNGIVRLSILNNYEINDAHSFFEKIKNNDKKAELILDDYTTLLAKFFYNLQVIYNVDCVILSGGMMKSKEYFFSMLKNKVDSLLKNTVFNKINFVDASFDQDAGLFGAFAVSKYY